MRYRFARYYADGFGPSGYADCRRNGDGLPQRSGRRSWCDERSWLFPDAEHAAGILDVHGAFHKGRLPREVVHMADRRMLHAYRDILFESSVRESGPQTQTVVEK